MEIIDIDGKDGKCIKCHLNLSPEEKKRRVPICTKCITELVNIAKDAIDIDGLEEYSDDVSNFTDFVSSSARLMGLGDIVIIQVCFNIYMDMVRGLGNKSIARKIFNDARRFIDIELERLEKQGEDFSKDGDFGNKDFFETIMGNLDEMMKHYHNAQSRDDDVNSANGNTNDSKSDQVSDRESDENKIKKWEESGVKRKRIRVD
jgi:hypothetical protein